jgi:hypothetical protein
MSKKLNRRPAGVALAFALASAFVLMVPPGPAFAYSEQPLSVNEKRQAAELAVKILSVIRAMAPHTSQTAYEGVILGVTSGKPCAVVRAAIVIVTDTPRLPVLAISAAKEVAKACGPIGAVGQDHDLVAGPGFQPGGGGAGYSR